MGKKIKRANGAGVPVTKFPRAPTSTDTPLASSTLPPTASTPGDAERTPFLDAFWKLADDDIKVRSNAGMVIIDHCYSPGVTADEGLNKDRSYALKRLMKGLCSGRGSARQGFASALQSFISAGQSQFTPEELHADLLLYTTPTGGGIKGTEEVRYCERVFYKTGLSGLLTLKLKLLTLPPSLLVARRPFRLSIRYSCNREVEYICQCVFSP